ncbi:hypothetical protein [Mycoplasma sp. Ms02]|uniref:hypothetical protein n=1 Tax=Mycoplasma sp. Ms02 TaxID=353851 RepID=UPI001C8951AB|nr:hypothetical protein [Mycoplasma sp. Ms02]QZE12490.1 hypothetical protein K4L35_00660 [Mycoplasma sp. Ms02]
MMNFVFSSKDFFFSLQKHKEDFDSALTRSLDTLKSDQKTRVLHYGYFPNLDFFTLNEIIQQQGINALVFQVKKFIKSDQDVSFLKISDDQSIALHNTDVVLVKRVYDFFVNQNPGLQKNILFSLKDQPVGNLLNMFLFSSSLKKQVEQINPIFKIYNNLQEWVDSFLVPAINNELFTKYFSINNTKNYLFLRMMPFLEDPQLEVVIKDEELIRLIQKIENKNLKKSFEDFVWTVGFFMDADRSQEFYNFIASAPSYALNRKWIEKKYAEFLDFMMIKDPDEYQLKTHIIPQPSVNDDLWSYTHRFRFNNNAKIFFVKSKANLHDLFKNFLLDLFSRNLLRKDIKWSNPNFTLSEEIFNSFKRLIQSKSVVIDPEQGGLSQNVATLESFLTLSLNENTKNKIDTKISQLKANALNEFLDVFKNDDFKKRGFSLDYKLVFKNGDSINILETSRAIRSFVESTMKILIWKNEVERDPNINNYETMEKLFEKNILYGSRISLKNKFIELFSGKGSYFEPLIGILENDSSWNAINKMVHYDFWFNISVLKNYQNSFTEKSKIDKYVLNAINLLRKAFENGLLDELNKIKLLNFGG